MLAFFKKQHEDCVLRKSEDIPFLSNSPYFTLQEKWRGKKHIALQDEELDLVMKFMENTSKSGQWRSTCDIFSSEGFALGLGGSISSGKVYIELIPFFSGHSFNSVSFLSPVIADGAVKILLFREDSGQPWHFQSNSFPLSYQLVTANTGSLLTWQSRLDQCSAAPSLFHFNSCRSSNCLLPTSATYWHPQLHSDHTPDNTCLISFIYQSNDIPDDSSLDFLGFQGEFVYKE